LRSLRLDYPGAIHHIFFRGNNKGEIFKSEEDYKFFLKALIDYKKQFGITLFAYCLMVNHVHLLIQSGQVHVGRFMQSLLTKYVQYFNKKYKRVGHLLQGRYKNVLVEREKYFLTLVKYIHLNPVKSGMVLKPEDYLWSSHNEYMGKKQPVVDRKNVIQYFDNLNSFSKFISSGKEIVLEEKRFKSYSFYGDEAFINSVLESSDQQKRVTGGQRKNITINDVENFIKKKFNLRFSDLKPYYSKKAKQYTAVILTDRLHLSRKETGKHMHLNFRSVANLYKEASNIKENILNEFDNFWKLED